MSNERTCPLIRRVSFVIGLALAMWSWLSGCSSDKARIVNKVAAIRWKSYTDQVSRMLARDSRKNLWKRTRNYQLDSDDILEVGVFEWETQNTGKTLQVRVTERGIISLPLLGTMSVRDKSVGQVQTMVVERLRQRGILVNPQVNVRIKEFRSKRVAVVGAVENAGIFNLRRNVTTLLDILGQAGGLSKHAGYLVYVVKGGDAADKPGSYDKRKINVDMHELVELGNLDLNVVLENGDVVYVPNAKQFSVAGFVNKAGSFPLKKPTTLLEAVALAGGLNEAQASPSFCTLKRRDISGNEQLIPVDLTAVIEKRRADMLLEPNDVLVVRQTSAKYLYNEFMRFFRITFGANIIDFFR